MLEIIDGYLTRHPLSCIFPALFYFSVHHSLGCPNNPELACSDSGTRSFGAEPAEISRCRWRRRTGSGVLFGADHGDPGGYRSIDGYSSSTSDREEPIQLLYLHLIHVPCDVIVIVILYHFGDNDVLVKDNWNAIIRFRTLILPALYYWLNVIRVVFPLPTYMRAIT